MTTSTEQLKTLYMKGSKHSNYQVLPRKLAAVLQTEHLQIQSRSEEARLAYILRHLDVAGKTMIDIGGNTGFFSFECVEHGATHVHYFEGNQAHAEFVKTAADLLDYSDKLSVYNQYYDFQEKILAEPVDVALLLNVLHHVGDDYGSSSSIAAAKPQILRQLNEFAQHTRLLAFQLGFNWRGNRELGLFEHGTKLELIDFIRKGTEGHWAIRQIGVAVRSADGSITYEEQNEQNQGRIDALGEFLNRPLFIMESLYRN